jgi:hypothetical protein
MKVNCAKKEESKIKKSEDNKKSLISVSTLHLGVKKYNVEPGLELVHGVEDDLSVSVQLVVCQLYLLE